MMRFVAMLTLFAATMGCSPVVPSTARLTEITYTPDQGETQITEIEYDSDGRPERAEVQQGGIEIREELFTFNEDGQLTEIVMTESNGTFSLTTTISYAWEDGRITGIISEGSGVDDPEGENVRYLTGSERELRYDDEGRLDRNDIRATVNLEQDVDLIIFETTLKLSLTETTEDSYDYNDDGTLSEVASEQTSLSVQTQDDEETGRTEESASQTLSIDYEDNRPDESTVSASRTETGADGNEVTVMESITRSFRYTDEGQLDEVDESYVVGEGDPITDNVEMRYDDDGRIEEIEDDDGRWEFEYGDEAVAGATFRSNRLPSFFDMAGRPGTHVVGLPTHLGY